jgi:hypothetical protein
LSYRLGLWTTRPDLNEEPPWANNKPMKSGCEAFCRGRPRRSEGLPTPGRLAVDLLDVHRRARDRVSREVRIAALESARDLLSEPEDEDPDLAARILLELADALPLERYAEGAELAEASLALSRDTQLRAAAHAVVANLRFLEGLPEEAWPHLTAGLAATVQLTSSNQPDRGDAVALELLAAVGFSDEPEAAAALFAALGLAAFYDEDRVPAILVALADAIKEVEPELARDCALEGIRRALPDGNERDAADGW